MLLTWQKIPGFPCLPNFNVCVPEHGSLGTRLLIYMNTTCLSLIPCLHAAQGQFPDVLGKHFCATIHTCIADSMSSQKHYLLLLRARPHEQCVIAYTVIWMTTHSLLCEAFGFESPRLFAAGHQDVELCCVLGNSHSVVPVIATINSVNGLWSNINPLARSKKVCHNTSSVLANIEVGQAWRAWYSGYWVGFTILYYYIAVPELSIVLG